MSKVKRMYMFNRGPLFAWSLLHMLVGVALAMASVSTWPGLAGLSDTKTTVTPITRATSEDSPGWDCLRQGNVTCQVDGVLVTSLVGLPDDPHGRCVFLLDISRRLDVDHDTRADLVCQAYAPTPDMP